MQYAVKVKDDYPYVSTCHVDNTARVQVVPNDGSNMRKILEAWYEKTKCPVLLNTSLNIRGKPIVNGRHDAQLFAAEYGVKVIS
jgi:carbamoyltransferase